MVVLKSISGLGGIYLIVVCLEMLQVVLSDQRICGSGLRKTLDFVCPNGFNGYKAKRSSLMPEDDYNSNSNEEDNQLAMGLDMLPFLNSIETNGLAKVHRKRHGIVHECCDKACSIDELRAYCRYPPY